MGLMDELKRLARPYEDEDEFEEEEEVKATPIREEKKPKTESINTAPAASTAPRAAAPRPTPVTPDTRSRKVVNLASGSNGMQVVLVKPDRFETAAEIADHLRDRRAVLMNLETTGKDTARRLIDFLSGVAYAQEGKIKKVAVSTYIITPYNVDIIGDRDLLDELESSGVYSFS